MSKLSAFIFFLIFMKNYLTEFIGTFFLVFTIALAVTQEVAMAPIAI